MAKNSSVNLIFFCSEILGSVVEEKTIICSIIIEVGKLEIGLKQGFGLIIDRLGHKPLKEKFPRIFQNSEIKCGTLNQFWNLE